MSKQGKIILAVLLCLSVSFLVVYAVANYKDTSTLSPELKEEIKVAYHKRMDPYSDLDVQDIPPLIWYDENGEVEEYMVWRYVGTYGDTVALLLIGNNQDMIFQPLEMPYLLTGLPRDVYYHVEADIFLYNTGARKDFDKLAHLYDLEYYNIKWLSNAQLEQLTKDIEAISKANN